MTHIKCIENLRCGILSLILLILFIVFFVTIVIPFWIFRWCVDTIAVGWRPCVYKMLDSTSQIALRGPIQYEQKNNITVSLKIGGKIHPGKLRDKIIQVFLHSKFEDGKLCYPEFKMFPEYWMGYPFWKLEENFRIEEHVRYEQIPRICTSSEDEEKFVHNYEVNLLKIPFQPEKSPWEIVCLEGNFKFSYVIFKFHHSMCDGEIIYRILMQVADNCGTFESPVKIQTQQWSLSKCVSCFTFPFEASFDFAKIITSLADSSTTPWTLKTNEMSKITRTIVSSRELINCKDVKAASRKLGVSFTALILTAVSAGIYNMMRKTKRNVRIPEDLITGYPIPHGNHPGTLTNHYSIITMKFPIRMTDPNARLRNIDDQIRKAKESTFPTAHNFLLRSLPGVFPHFIYTKIDPADTVVLGINNFPGPRHPVTIQGLQVLDLNYKLFQATFTSVLITMCSYNGQLRISCNADPKIFPTEDIAQELLDEISLELSALIDD